MRCKLTASVAGDPARLYALISSVEGPGLVDWPDVDPRAGVEQTIGLLLRPGTHGGAVTFDQARRVAAQVHERLAERIERERRSAELGRIVPFDLQSIEPIPREVLVGGYHAGGRDWLVDHWGVDMPLAQVDLKVQTRIQAEQRGRGRPRAGSQRRCWTETTATWTFLTQQFPWACFRSLLKQFADIQFSVEFEDNDGPFARVWSAIAASALEQAA